MSENERKISIKDSEEESKNTDQKSGEDHPDNTAKSPKKNTAAKPKSPSKKVHDHLKEQEIKIKKLIHERDEFKDKYLRNLAEIDNFRKRVKKEKEDYRKYILSEFLLGLLEVVDNLERALKTRNSTNSEQSIISGVEMIYKQFLDLLKKHEVIEVEALNKPFDPNFHEALSKEEKEDIEEAIVIEVYQKGFVYNGKLLRPTLAKVAIPAEKENPKEEEIKED